MCIERPFFHTLRRYRTVLKGSVVKPIYQVSKLLYMSGVRSLLYEVATRDDALDTTSREELCNAILQNCIHFSSV